MRSGFSEADAVAGVRHARAALTYGTDDATALAVASLALLHLGHDFQAASGAVARALLLNGSYWGAHVHALSGDPAIAEDYAVRALRLSPFDPMSWLAHMARGFVRMREGRYSDAALLCFDSVQANPRFSVLIACEAAALGMAGRIDESKSAAKRVLELEPTFRISPFIGFFSAFMRPELLNPIASGLRLTGLPE